MTSPPASFLELTMTYADLLQLQADLIWVYDAEVARRNLNLSRHCPGQSALLVREGSVVLSDRRHEVLADAGDWVFLREGDRQQRFTEGSKVLSIRFKLGWPGGIPLFDWDPAMTVRAAEYPELEVKAKRLYEVVKKETAHIGMKLQESRVSPISHCLIRSEFLSFVSECIRVQINAGLKPNLMRKLNVRVQRMLAYLDEHGFQKSFRQTELAKAMGLSGSQLDRLFKKELGMTPHQYQEQRRLEHAFLRLRRSEDSIKEIAFDLGFASPSHFSAWLRRKTHLTPSELREDEKHAFYPYM